MKLLFDENLSPRLASLLSADFPGSAHVRDCGLKGRDDREIWTYAASHGFIVVSKDDDFQELAVLKGAPPKVIMVRMGNSTTEQVAIFLRGRPDRIKSFEGNVATSVLELP